MIIKGKRILISPLKIEDVKTMRSWGVHDTILLGDYNFPYESDREIKKWFKYKTFTIRNKYFGVHNEEGILLGFIGIKNKKFFRRSSFLGIVFDPRHLNKGYGTESLETFLPFYFGEMNMKVLYLEVAEFNKRAIRVYEKLGFASTEYYLDMFQVEGVDKSHPEIIQEESCFVFKGEKIYNYIYKMKLTKDKFIELKNGITN